MRPPASPRRRRAWFLRLVGVALVLALAVAGFRRGERPPLAPTSATAALAMPASALPLRVTLHIKNLYNLQLESQTFSADGWYRLDWDQRLQEQMGQAEIASERLVEFDNQVETWDAQIEAETPAPIREADGNYSQTFRFSARFFIPSLDLRRSPFETIVLPVVMEIRPDRFSLGRQPVLLEPSSHNLGIVGDYGDVTGYELRDAVVVAGVNTYDSQGRQPTRRFSQLAVRVTYGSDVLAAFLKWILPLLIVMIVVLLAPSLEGSLGDIRLAIPSSALLTLVFLQQTYRAELPATPYPTFLDLLYAYSYLVALGLFLLFVWSSNLFEHTPEEQRGAMRARINRVDAITQWGAFLGFLVWAALAWRV